MSSDEREPAFECLFVSVFGEAGVLRSRELEELLEQPGLVCYN